MFDRNVSSQEDLHPLHQGKLDRFQFARSNVIGPELPRERYVLLALTNMSHLEKTADYTEKSPKRQEKPVQVCNSAQAKPTSNRDVVIGGHRVYEETQKASRPFPKKQP